jgi:hypothetical protein
MDVAYDKGFDTMYCTLLRFAVLAKEHGLQVPPIDTHDAQMLLEVNDEKDEASMSPAALGAGYVASSENSFSRHGSLKAGRDFTKRMMGGLADPASAMGLDTRAGLLPKLDGMEAILKNLFMTSTTASSRVVAFPSISPTCLGICNTHHLTIGQIGYWAQSLLYED